MDDIPNHLLLLGVNIGWVGSKISLSFFGCPQIGLALGFRYGHFFTDLDGFYSRNIYFTGKKDSKTV